MRLIFLNVIAIFMASGCHAERFPSARFLGMGYNVITGNPDSNLRDPGFSFGVINFTWVQGHKTSDEKYKVPDYVQALQTKSCSFQSEVSTVTGSESYQDSLSIDVSVDAKVSFGPWSARFSASAGYKEVNQSTSEYRRVYTNARGKCIEYELAVNYMDSPIKITDDFARAVNGLPLSPDQAAYNTFINNYGTHVTSRVTMGAKMVIRSEFEQEAWSKMQKSGVDVAVAAEASFAYVASAGFSVETAKEKQQRESFERQRSKHSESYLGSHPPSDGKMETWAAAAGDAPYPVSYKLAPLTAFITAKFFPDIPERSLSKRRKLLTSAFDRYCSDIVGCGEPGPDEEPVDMASTVSDILGSAINQSCEPEYMLLSCGIQNSKASGTADRNRYAIPATSTACECKDTAGAKCVAWCTNVQVEIRIIKNHIQTTGAVSCPSGYKVLLVTILVCLLSLTRRRS